MKLFIDARVYNVKASHKKWVCPLERGCGNNHSREDGLCAYLIKYRIEYSTSSTRIAITILITTRITSDIAKYLLIKLEVPVTAGTSTVCDGTGHYTSETHPCPTPVTLPSSKKYLSGPKVRRRSSLLGCLCGDSQAMPTWRTVDGAADNLHSGYSADFSFHPYICGCIWYHDALA